MDIKTIKNTLEVLSSVGIEEVIFEPREDEKCLIRGSNKDRNVVIYDEMKVYEELVHAPLGIQSVNGLLSRIELFDIDKTTVTAEDNESIITKLNIKQGRKKASFKCSDPEYLVAPSRVPGNLNEGVSIILSREYVNYLSKIVASMSYTGSKNERTISIEAKNGEYKISIYDGESDTFSDVVEIDDKEVVTNKFAWEVSPFQRVIKQSLEYSNTNEACFNITEHGIAVFNVAGLSIMIPPVS